MKSSRPLLLLTSVTLMVLLLGGGIAMRVSAEDNSYRQAVLFAEIMSLVMENYVDQVETSRLLEGAYEGLLAGLDANGAYLTAEEVGEWKAVEDSHAADKPHQKQNGREKHGRANIRFENDNQREHRGHGQSGQNAVDQTLHSIVVNRQHAGHVDDQGQFGEFRGLKGKPGDGNPPSMVVDFPAHIGNEDEKQQEHSG